MSIPEPLMLPRRNFAVQLINDYLDCDTGDNRFTEIAKDYGNKGTTCGFLCHWLLWKLGCQNTNIVNRSEPPQFQYRIGENLSRLYNLGKPPFNLVLGKKWFEQGMLPKTGDIILIQDTQQVNAKNYNSQHVLVFLEQEIRGDGIYWHTAEAGGTNQAGKQCARKRIRKLIANSKLNGHEKTVNDPFPYAGPRDVVGWLPLAELTYGDNLPTDSPLSGLWNALDAAIEGEGVYVGKSFFFSGAQYFRYVWQTGTVDLGYPQNISSWGFPSSFQNGIDAAINGQRKYVNKAYFFKGDQYIRYDWATDQVEFSQPLSAWNFPPQFQSNIDAAINGQGDYAGKTFFFKGKQYICYDWKTGQLDPGYPRSIDTWNFPINFHNGLSAACNGVKPYSGKAYFFHRDQYLRYDWTKDQIDDGFPLSIAGSWY